MVGRKAAFALGLALVLAVGCGDGGGETSSTTSTTLSELDCPGPIAIASTADLVEVLAGITWEGLGEYTSGLLSITPDLVVSGTVVLEAADLPIPQNCLDRPDCSQQGAFRMGGPVPGVLAEGAAEGPCTSGYSRLTFTDTTLRLRPALYDTHPCQYNFVPVVAVVPPCGTPCDEGRTLCPADGACYEAGEAYCRLCEGGSKEACACRGSEGPLEEGASCTYWVSGDVQCVGACRQGACESANSLCR